MAEIVHTLKSIFIIDIYSIVLYDIIRFILGLILYNGQTYISQVQT